MAKRDPEKTAINRMINEMTDSLNADQDYVIQALGGKNVHSLHGRLGGKNAEFIDIKNEVIPTPEVYVARWTEGFLNALDQRDFMFHDPYEEMLLALQGDPRVLSYVVTFLKRTFLRNAQSLSRVRPTVEDAEIWIGQERASYGILVTPRYVYGKWENDKSEIRHFPVDYWTIGHVLRTGLVVPGDPDKLEFHDTNAYLTFFKNTLVRASGSVHEKAIADRYVEYVRLHADPTKVPLLIPEFRYGGIAQAHKYRLDFTVIDPTTMSKVGFELSPWSTHGELKGTRDKTQKQINEEAKENFEREMRKHKDYFRKFGLHGLIYTDSDLANPDALFEDIKKYLKPKSIDRQLEVVALDALSKYKPNKSPTHFNPFGFGLPTLHSFTQPPNL